MIDATTVTAIAVYPDEPRPDTCDRVPVDCYMCGYVGPMWTDRDIDPAREPCIFCN